METSLVSVKPEEARLLSEFRQKVWAKTYRGIYPDKLIDEFDFGLHDSKNLFMINSEEYSVYFINADGEKAGYLRGSPRHPRQDPRGLCSHLLKFLLIREKIHHRHLIGHPDLLPVGRHLAVAAALEAALQPQG